MPLLKYWIAERLDDHRCYSLIGKTRKEVVAELAKYGDWAKFGPVHKREIFYEDAFDLFDYCTGEGGDRMIGTGPKPRK